jgi:hypothetical protein
LIANERITARRNATLVASSAVNNHAKSSGCAIIGALVAGTPAAQTTSADTAMSEVRVP